MYFIYPILCRNVNHAICLAYYAILLSSRYFLRSDDTIDATDLANLHERSTPCIPILSNHLHFMVYFEKVLKPQFGLRSSRFCYIEKGFIRDQKVKLRLATNAHTVRAVAAFFDPSISKFYASKTMVASLFPIHTLAMDKRFCHAKNIVKKYRKTLLHAFSELRAVVLSTSRRSSHFFIMYQQLYLISHKSCR